MKTLCVLLLALGLAASIQPVAAEEDNAAPAQAPAPLLSSDQLRELMGPIALYPDPLISLILPASTVTSDIVMADRFITSGGNPDEVEDKPWDPSVKGLVRYPDTLKWLDDNLDWTAQVGDAFSNQPGDVMDAIQGLRAKAKDLGNLADTPEQRVVQDDEGDNVIRVVPAEPDALYVPSYDPEVVYVDRPVAEPLVYFSPPYVVGPWLDYDCDWYHHRVCYGDWHRGWDYSRHHHHDHGDRFFVSNNITNARTWQVNAQRRRLEERRRLANQQQLAANRRNNVVQVQHPRPHNIGRHQGETIRRAETPGGGVAEHRFDRDPRNNITINNNNNNNVGNNHRFGEGNHGRVITPRTQAPNTEPRLGNLGSRGGSNLGSHLGDPGSHPRPHVEERRFTPGSGSGSGGVVRKATPAPHIQPRSQVKTLPGSFGRPHSESFHSMPKVAPHAKPQVRSNSMPRHFSPPHASHGGGGAPRHVSTPHPHARASSPKPAPKAHAAAPKARSGSSKGDPKKKHH